MLKVIAHAKVMIKKIMLILLYTACIASFGYAIWFAIKNRKNGNNIFINLLIGVFDGILRFGSFIFTSWAEKIRK